MTIPLFHGPFGAKRNSSFFNLKFTHPLKIAALVVLKSAGLPNGPRNIRFLHRRCRCIR